MNYSVVLFPSQEVQESANSYRKRYDSLFALIPPFIRLKEVFQMEEDQVPALVDHLAQVAKRTKPFTLTFHRVASFHPTNNVIYYGMQEKEPVIQLHEQIVQFLPEHKELYAFVPHLTIGRNLTDGELKDVLGELSMKKLDLACEIDQMHLIREEQDGSWKIVKSFPFNQ